MPGTLAVQTLQNFLAVTGLQRAGWVLRLFVNDFVPDAFSTRDQFQEASYGGYLPYTLNAWGPIFLAGNDVATVAESLRQFQVGTAPFDQIVYGYFLTDPAGNYVGAERHSGPGFAMSVPGATYSLIVRVSVTNAYSPPGSPPLLLSSLSVVTRPQPPEGRDE